MSIALWVSYVFVGASQLAVAWLISMELWFVKRRPWGAALLQFLLGLVILAVAQVVAGFLTTAVIIAGLLTEQELETGPSAFVALLIFVGVVVLAIRLTRLAILQKRVLQWQNKAAL